MFPQRKYFSIDSSYASDHTQIVQYIMSFSIFLVQRIAHSFHNFMHFQFCTELAFDAPGIQIFFKNYVVLLPSGIYFSFWHTQYLAKFITRNILFYHKDFKQKNLNVKQQQVVLS